MMKKHWTMIVPGAVLMTTAFAAPASAVDLKTAIQQALQTNPEIHQAVQNKAATQWERRQAEGLYYPRVSVELSGGVRELQNPSRRSLGIATDTLYPLEAQAMVEQLLMDNGALKDDCATKMKDYDVRPPDPSLAAKNFSGGNQQKIVVAREIERSPDLRLVGQPTRGVDIGAIEFIHKQIVRLRDEGKAVLLVSVELDEIFALSDRIAVMFDGKIMGERLPGETNEKELGLLMAGVTSGAPDGRQDEAALAATEGQTS